ncbi:hypothetical protein PR048_023348 [Dryococelus australis]|uniref:Secreted protein n=1 Tax=Dryococelus australis TaxID=614101 RepID=A0ABQ9GTW7_9NEOP|nr:hypothetical protein PR048_023348 [Dryococelus australis]
MSSGSRLCLSVCGRTTAMARVAATLCTITSDIILPISQSYQSPLVLCVHADGHVQVHFAMPLWGQGHNKLKTQLLLHVGDLYTNWAEHLPMAFFTICRRVNAATDQHMPTFC